MKSKESKQSRETTMQAMKPERSGLKQYLRLHLQTCLFSLGRQLRTPFTSLLTYAVIGIALALPTGFLLVLNNLQTISLAWDNGAQLSLFLKAEVNDQQAEGLVQQLQDQGSIKKVRYISPAQGLEQFKQQSGFSEVMKTLTSNPLPGVIEVEPADNVQTPIAVNHLYAWLKQLPQVDIVQLDMQWVQRLYAIIQLIKRGVYALATLLGLGVIVIIGNTIRLSLQSYQEEIKIIKLMGATQAFIRRPYLYTGIFAGLFGAVLAVLLVDSMILILGSTLEKLTLLYQSAFVLPFLNLTDVMLIVCIGILFGLVGSWLAVQQHLQLRESE